MKHKKYNTKRRRNQKAQWKLLLAVTLMSATAILLPFALDVINEKPTGVPAVTIRREVVKAVESSGSQLSHQESVEEMIRRIAKEMNFQWTDYLVRLANCESRLNPKAVNKQNNNPKHSVDRGLFQINNHWHKNVSDEQAFDPEFSIRWSINKINTGGQGIWVCDKYVRANPSKYNP